MTYRYYNIRREINNDNSEKGLKEFSSLKELKSLFTPFHWIVFIAIILSLVALLFTAFFSTNKLWCSIPLVILVVLVNIWEYKCEKLYNQKAREKELNDIDEKYKQYLNNTYEILKKNGINTREQLLILKNECNIVFNERENKFKILNNKVFELFIGVPIGALISSLIDENNIALSSKVIAILIFGLIIYGIVALTKYFSYYTEGYWKDQHLLDVVTEMEYYFSIMEDNKIEKEVKKMKISHNDALTLETLVRKVHNCERFGMGMYIDADHFETNPFDAALIALSPIWKNLPKETVEEFLYRWDCSLRKEDDTNISQFIQELKELVNY